MVAWGPSMDSHLSIDISAEGPSDPSVEDQLHVGSLSVPTLQLIHLSKLHSRYR